MTNEIPKVKVKRTTDTEWIVDCPFCKQEHIHGNMPGLRMSHCEYNQQTYEVVGP